MVGLSIRRRTEGISKAFLHGDMSTCIKKVSSFAIYMRKKGKLINPITRPHRRKVAPKRQVQMIYYRRVKGTHSDRTKIAKVHHEMVKIQAKISHQ
jgi:hypothetical protein